MLADGKEKVFKCKAISEQPWLAMAGQGSQWPAMAIHGWPWLAMALLVVTMSYTSWPKLTMGGQAMTSPNWRKWIGP